MFVQGEEGIESDFPEVAVGIGDIAGIAAPEDLLRRLHELCATGDGKFHDGINADLARDIVGKRHAGKAGRRVLDMGVLGQACSGEETERDAFQLDKGDVVVGGWGFRPAEP